MLFQTNWNWWRGRRCRTSHCDQADLQGCLAAVRSLSSKPQVWFIQPALKRSVGRRCSATSTIPVLDVEAAVTEPARPSTRRRKLPFSVPRLNILGVVAIIVAATLITVHNLHHDNSPNQILNVSYPERVVRERVPGDPVDPSTIIYDFEGELFFGAAPELERYLEALSERIRQEDIKFLVLRLKRVRHPDAVVIERIEKFVREETDRGVTVLLAGVQSDLWTLLKNVGFGEWFPSERVFPEEDEEFSATLKAVRYAHALRGFDESGVPVPVAAVAGNGESKHYCYLV
ncbi:MAG: sodium-independent anion transporter [Mycobacterium sp.]|nr:sodium-independent anion transporter [Mycobacterium sp.]